RALVEHRGESLYCGLAAVSRPSEVVPLIYLVIGLIAGAIAASVASSKGRSAVGYFFFGFFLPLPGIIVACVVSNLKVERRRYEEQTAERRRLKEQLRQEKLKSESFRRFTSTRLDSHDRVL